MSRLVIYGAGGFGREIVTAARSSGREIVFLDDDPQARPFASIDLIRHADLKHSDEVVISVADGSLRRDLAAKCPRFGTVVAPTAVIGGDVRIGTGAVICDFSTLTASVVVGQHFHCNIYSYVAHDCVIGDFVTFAPRVCCNGSVHIHDGAYIGTGAVIKQGTSDKPLVIGEGAIVGMGAVVTKDVPAGATVIGSPARPMN